MSGTGKGLIVLAIMRKYCSVREDPVGLLLVESSMCLSTPLFFNQPISHSSPTSFTHTVARTWKDVDDIVREVHEELAGQK